MDFWTRLIGGSNSPKKPPDLNNPHQRLASFKRAYNNLLQIWHNGDGDYTNAFVAENARICLRRLAELLNDDGRGPTPHLCVSFAATSRILVIVAKLATAFRNDGITHEALGICSLLIDNEEEAFLEDQAFADMLPKFIEEVTTSSLHMIDQEIESSMLEVLFGVASKIRLEPHILPIWFRLKTLDPRKDDVEGTDQNAARATRNEEFPLFYLLLNYVPSEGRAGEFARMGLLYLIESAASSEILERWIVEGDMAALMASGLGALYSQLSRKLALTYTRAEIPSILAFSDRAQPRKSVDAEETTSPEYQAHLATFLASLVFWQDLLEHCTSMDVKQTLLDHFQFLFLQQLLYPSLLESSDIDGGSAVAVLTYLRHIFESIDHPDLVRLTLQYLFGLRDTTHITEDSSKPITAVRRRKSADLLTHLANNGGEQPTPDLFNLADLILASLRSSSQQTINATLQLLSAMLRRQQHQVSPILLRTRQARFSDERRTVGGQEKEIDNFLTLAENLTRFQDLETSYESHLYDNRNLLELHSCSMQLLPLPKSEHEATDASAALAAGPLINAHVLRNDDPILKSLVDVMTDFLRNDIETNLGLTRVLVDLASCGQMRLEGWLLTETSRYWFPEDVLPVEKEAEENGEALSEFGSDIDTEIDPQIQKMILARREPSWGASDLSPVFKTLDLLVRQVESYRQEINDFDKYLLECRAAVEMQDSSNTSSHGQNTPRESQDSPRISPSRLKNVGQIGSITERLRSERAGGSESRNGSPRGRQLDLSSTPTLVGRFTRLQLSPTRTPPSQNSSRTYSASPLRKDPFPSTPPRVGRSIPSVSAALRTKIRIGSGLSMSQDNTEPSSEDSSVRSESVGPEARNDGSGEVTIGHLMTNVIILQEFILELAALVEVRASMFGEVRYI